MAASSSTRAEPKTHQRDHARPKNSGTHGFGIHAVCSDRICLIRCCRSEASCKSLALGALHYARRTAHWIGTARARTISVPTSDMNLQSRRDIHLFCRRLLRWYDGHKRDLPWRKDCNVYRVWLSEIMLQQTRVAAVLEHYRTFVEQFPTLQKLAAARESSVLAAWSGLGYYRRARMLHRAAREMVSKHAAQFPDTAAELRELPGIGPYTAAAIASICFGERIAVVDGNVERVLGRVMGRNLSRAEAWQFAQRFLNPNRPGDFNQAMMELGATVCAPRQPRCFLCPVSDLCATTGGLPRIAIKPRQKKKEISYLLDRRNGSVFLIHRTQHSSLMPGMWELPEIPSANGSGDSWITVRHSITTTDYLVRVVKGRAPDGTQGSWVRVSRLAELPLTGLARKILRVAKVI